MIFGNYDAFFLFFVLLIAVLPAVLWAFWRRRTLLKVLAEQDLLPSINTSVRVSRQILKACLLMAAFALIVLALTRPKWNPKPREIKRQGRDVVILLDTSRSMLAEDIKPDRLERAKLAIRDLIEKIRGDRIGLVTFAGTSSVKCPLTQDYAFLRLALEDVTTESTALGGTNVGDAIRRASQEVFDQQVKEFKDIILITDCDDLEDSFPVEAAKQAGQQGIRIIAVGLGDPVDGARIPITGADGSKTFLKFDGKEVWTKLDEATLRKTAAATPGGAYIPVRTGTFDLGQIYEELVRQAEKRELEEASVIEYDEAFQIFLAAALILLISEGWISECRKK